MFVFSFTQVVLPFGEIYIETSENVIIISLITLPFTLSNVSRGPLDRVLEEEQEREYNIFTCTNQENGSRWRGVNRTM